MGNHGAAGGISERRHSSCSSLCSGSVTAVLYAISCYIGPRYNGTRMCFCLIFTDKLLLSKARVNSFFAIQFQFQYMYHDCQFQFLFTPQPSGLEGYCCHGPGGRAAAKLVELISLVTARQIFSIRSSVELSKPVVVHRHDHLPIGPIWVRWMVLAHLRWQSTYSHTHFECLYFYLDLQYSNLHFTTLWTKVGKYISQPIRFQISAI